MPRRLAWLDPWQLAAVDAVRQGCVSPTDVVRYLAVHTKNINGTHITAADIDDPMSMARRFTIMALERATDDGEVTWPRSPNGASIEGGIRPV